MNFVLFPFSTRFYCTLRKINRELKLHGASFMCHLLFINIQDGRFGLQYNFNYIWQIEDVETVDWDVLAQFLVLMLILLVVKFQLMLVSLSKRSKTRKEQSFSD